MAIPMIVFLQVRTIYIYIYNYIYIHSCVHLGEYVLDVVKEVTSFPGAQSINGHGT